MAALHKHPGNYDYVVEGAGQDWHVIAVDRETGERITQDIWSKQADAQRSADESNQRWGSPRAWSTTPGWRAKREIPAAVDQPTAVFLEAEQARARAAGFVPVGRGKRIDPSWTVIAVPTCTSKGGPGVRERIYFSRWYRPAEAA